MRGYLGARENAVPVVGIVEISAFFASEAFGYNSVSLSFAASSLLVIKLRGGKKSTEYFIISFRETAVVYDVCLFFFRNVNLR